MLLFKTFPKRWKIPPNGVILMFTKSDFFQYDADCFFLGAPFNKDSDFIKFMKNLTALSFNKKILLIIVNYNKKIIEEFKDIKFIESYYISNNKGYSICCLDNN